MSETLVKFLLDRLKEPSTWGGLTTVLTGLGVYLSPEQAAAIVTLGVAVGGALMVFMPEGGNK